MDELKVVQFITQIGAFGLLVFITYCFIRYLPKHFAELAKERADYQQAIILQAGEHRKSIELLNKMFTDEIERERGLCDERYKELKADDQARYEKLEREYEGLQNKISTFETNIREIKHEVNNIAHAKAMEQQVKDAQIRQSRKSSEQQNNQK